MRLRRGERLSDTLTGGFDMDVWAILGLMAILAVLLAIVWDDGRYRK